jgi:nucleotide-binding universal stress UspA family protein
VDILVCLEGSPSTAVAVGLAIDLARTLRATLVGLAIVDVPDIIAGSATSIGGASYRRERDATLLEDARERASAWREGFVAHARAAGVAVRGLEVSGSPAEAILEEVPKHDLVVLGRHVNFRHETQDSDRYTRDRILRRAGRPILVAPDLPGSRSPVAMVAYDGSPAAIRAIRAFVAAGLARDREIHVATVDDDGATAFETATRGCALLAELGVRAVPENLVSTDPVAVALLSRAAKLDAGLVVAGGYIPSPLARLMWGSVTHDLIERAAVPVFLHY